MYTLLRHSGKAKDSGLCVHVWQREHMFQKVEEAGKEKVAEAEKTEILHGRVSSTTSTL